MMAVLFGRTLIERDPSEEHKALVSHLKAVIGILKDLYEDCPLATFAFAELQGLTELGIGVNEFACLRAALLVAMHQEREVYNYFTRQALEVEQEMLKDLKDRVLPFCVGHFLHNSAQHPDALVCMASLFCTQFKETLGNWPRTTIMPVGS